jgi:hypothetical protein
MVAGRIARSASAGSLRDTDLADLFLGAGPHPATEPITELNPQSAGATDGRGQPEEP